MGTRAADHLHVVKQIAFRRARIGDQSYRTFDDRETTWEHVMQCARSLRLLDGSASVRSMQYGTCLQDETLGVYTGYTRHIDIAAWHLTESVLGTCLHEFAHSLLHWDVNTKTAEANSAWLECEADVTADITLMLMGYAPRRQTQKTLAAEGLAEIGDVAAFFHFAGPTCLETAENIYRTWEKQNACQPQPAAIRAA